MLFFWGSPVSKNWFWLWRSEILWSFCWEAVFQLGSSLCFIDVAKDNLAIVVTFLDCFFIKVFAWLVPVSRGRTTLRNGISACNQVPNFFQEVIIGYLCIFPILIIWRKKIHKNLSRNFVTICLEMLFSCWIISVISCFAIGHTPIQKYNKLTKFTTGNIDIKSEKKKIHIIRNLL